jgi:hypothetical protein
VIDLAHQKVNLLLVSFPLGHVLGHAKKQPSSIGLGSEGGANKTPKALATVFGADRHFGRLRLRLFRNDVADMLKHFARVFAVGASRPVLDAPQVLSRIAGLFEPALAESKNLLAIVAKESWQWRVED